MIEIRALLNLDRVDLERVASGYVSDHKYAVVHTDGPDFAAIELRLVALTQPYTKKYEFADEILGRYNTHLSAGFSFGAYDGEQLVGILIAEGQDWNQSLCIHEFHVEQMHQRTGIGSRLMQHAIKTALAKGLRIVVCETQNTNVPAIEVYRKLGFRIESIDISHYSNDDYPDGEIAIFMKFRLE